MSTPAHPPAEALGTPPDALFGGVPDGPSSLALPRDTTPTYEPELLVSGIVLVALFQLPGFFAAAAAHFGPHFANPAGAVAVDQLRLVGTAAVYALITCFVLHLALRGFWVALVGTHSIFPGGTRWERMRESGPIARQLYRERLRPLPHYIARLDNAATLVFTGGFIVAAYIVASLVGGAAALTVLGAVLTLVPQPPVWLVVLLPTILLAPLVVLPILDLKRGLRMETSSRAYRATRMGLRVVTGYTPSSVHSAMTVLSSNVDKRAVYGLITLVMGGAFAGAALNRDAGVPGAGAYRYFDDGSERRGLVADFYDADRPPGARDARTPSIPAEVASGPYLRLFIPYVPRRMNDAMPRLCPGVRPLGASGRDADADTAGADAVLRCAARIHRVALDGRPLDAVRLRFYLDPQAERRGFVAQIPVESLAAGEHALTVWPAPRPGEAAAKEPWTIPFWR